MLDFRFLIGTLLVGVALAVAALRLFGPVESPHFDPSVSRQPPPASVRTPIAGSLPQAVPPKEIAAPEIPRPPESISRMLVKDLPVQADHVETTGSIQLPAELTELPPVKPKPRAIAAARKREGEFGEFNLFKLLFPQSPAWKQSAPNRPPASSPFTQ